MSAEAVFVAFGFWIVLIMILRVAVLPRHKTKINEARSCISRLVENGRRRRFRNYPYFKALKELEGMTARSEWYVSGVFGLGVVSISAAGLRTVVFREGTILPAEIEWVETLVIFRGGLFLCVLIFVIGAIVIWRDFARLEEFEQWLGEETPRN